MQNSKIQKSWDNFASNMRAWKLDTIYEGTAISDESNLIAYCPSRSDSTSGLFIMVTETGWNGGRYKNAVSHVRKAMFQDFVGGNASSYEMALEKAKIMFPQLAAIIAFSKLANKMQEVAANAPRKNGESS